MGKVVAMRVAFVVNNYPPRVGGVERHVQALARELSRRDHEITIVTLAEETSTTDAAEGLVVRLQEHHRIGDVLGFPPLGTRTKLVELLKDRGVDIISVHTRFFPMTWLGVSAARTLGVPAILTEHGSNHVASPSPFVSTGALAVDKSLGRTALRRADRVLGVSEDVVDFVGRLSGREATLFYNAIELPEVSYTVEPRPGHLAFVGRLVAGKGWDTFIDTVTELRTRGHDVVGTLIGGGPDEPEARRRASGTAVDVLGRVSPEEVAAHLAGATLVNPTTLSEGFQTTLLEVLAGGGRAVTYPVPGARALADDGAPVLVTRGRLRTELVSGIETFLTTPPPAYPGEKMQRWSWAARADQFEGIMEELSR